MNKQQAMLKGLSEANYKALENKYKYLFEKYLFSKTNLRPFEIRLDNSNCYIGVGHPTPNQLISGLNEYLGSKYVYILNNFFVEKLSSEELRYLSICSYDDPQAMEFIARTYKEIIKNNFTNGIYTDKIYKVCYGVAVPENFVQNDALVFKIFHGKNSKSLEGEEYINNMGKQREFFDALKKDIINEVSTKLNIPCAVLVEKIPN